MLATQEKPRPKKRGRPAARSAGETRQAILLAARQCFAVAGFTATTNNQIAEAVGITASALYNHFKSKNDLYIAVCVETEKEITQFHQDAVHGIENSREALVSLIEKSIVLYEQDPSLSMFGAKVSVEMVNNPDLAIPLAEKILGGVEKIVKQVIKKGQSKGEISKKIHADDIFNMYVASSMGMAQTSVL